MLPPASISTAIVSIERGAGPKTRTPAFVYVEPWQGHRNQPLSPSKLKPGRQGTEHPRCGHFRHSAITPSPPPAPPGRVSVGSRLISQNCPIGYSFGLPPFTRSETFPAGTGPPKPATPRGYRKSRRMPTEPASAVARPAQKLSRIKRRRVMSGKRRAAAAEGSVAPPASWVRRVAMACCQAPPAPCGSFVIADPLGPDRCQSSAYDAHRGPLGDHRRVVPGPVDLHPATSEGRPDNREQEVHGDESGELQDHVVTLRLRPADAPGNHREQDRKPDHHRDGNNLLDDQTRDVHVEFDRLLGDAKQVGPQHPVTQGDAQSGDRRVLAGIEPVLEGARVPEPVEARRP